MATNTQQEVARTASVWGRRVNQLRGMGMAPEKLQRLQPLIQQDLTKVNQGQTAMTSDDALAAAMSVTTGKSVVKPKKRGTGLFDIPGNVVGDITETATGWLPGLARYVYHLPSETQKSGQYFEDVMAGKKKLDLQTLQQNAPLTAMIPGVHTVGMALSSEGRKELERHPLGTALDIAPVLTGAAKVAGLSGIGEEGGALNTALRAGKPIKATYVGMTTQGLRKTIGDHGVAVLNHFGVGPEDFKMSRKYTVIGRQVAQKAENAVEEHVVQQIYAMSDEERQLLHQEATRPDLHPAASISPEHQQIFNTLRAAEQDLASLSRGKLTEIQWKGGHYVYPTKSPVGKAHTKLIKAENKLADVRAEHSRVTTRVVTRETTRLRKQLATAQKELSAAQKAGNADGVVVAALKIKQTVQELGTVPRHPEIIAHQAKIETQRTAAKDARAKMEKSFQKHPEASFVPMLEADKMNRAIDLAASKENFNPAKMQDVIQQIQRGDLHGYVTPREWNDITRAANESWTRLVDQGFHPVWVHQVNPSRVDAMFNTKPLTDHVRSPTQFKERIGDLTPKMTDLAVSLSAAAIEHLRAEGDQAFVDYLTQGTKTWGDISKELHDQVDLWKAKGKLPRGTDEQGALVIAYNRKYTTWTPDKLFNNEPLTAVKTIDPSARFIEKHSLDTARKLASPKTQSAAGRSATKLTSIYKTSIMTFSAKHLSHITFGGLMFMLLQGGVDEIRRLPEAISMVRQGRMPAELPQKLDVMTHDQLWSYAGGATLGRIWKASTQRIYSIEEWITNVQRADAMLGEEARSLRKGMSPGAAREAGLAHAQKTLVDFDNFTPVEQTIVRQVFPFYGYVRHVLKYALTYPIDHPVRISILSNIAHLENANWNSGLPQQFQNLFWLGSPDKNGNVTGLDARSMNPFRDMGNWFTFAGFWQSINPALSTAYVMAGGNKYSGSADLYPQLSYNEKTGQLEAKRPADQWLTALGTFAPSVTSAIDYFGGVSQAVRQYRAANPQGFGDRLYSIAFLPFAPKHVNISQTEAKTQIDRLKVAQGAVTEATTTGDTSVLDKYDIVPYQGALVPASYVKQLVEAAKKQYPGAVPKTKLKKKSSRRASF